MKKTVSTFLLFMTFCFAIHASAQAKALSERSLSNYAAAFCLKKINNGCGVVGNALQTSYPASCHHLKKHYSFNYNCPNIAIVDDQSDASEEDSDMALLSCQMDVPVLRNFSFHSAELLEKNGMTPDAESISGKPFVGSYNDMFGAFAFPGDERDDNGELYEKYRGLDLWFRCPESHPYWAIAATPVHNETTAQDWLEQGGELVVRGHYATRTKKNTEPSLYGNRCSDEAMHDQIVTELSELVDKDGNKVFAESDFTGYCYGYQYTDVSWHRFQEAKKCSYEGQFCMQTGEPGFTVDVYGSLNYLPSSPATYFGPIQPFTWVSFPTGTGVFRESLVNGSYVDPSGMAITYEPGDRLIPLAQTYIDIPHTDFLNKGSVTLFCSDTPYFLMNEFKKSTAYEMSSQLQTSLGFTKD